VTLEPRLGELPIAHDGVGRDLDDCGRFLDGEAAEETQFNHAALALVEGRQRLQRIVESDEVMTRFGGNRQGFVEIGSACHAAALRRKPAARVIDKNLPHHAAAQRMEMHAIANGNRFALQEAEKRFVDERGGLQRVSGALVRHVVDGDTVQLPVHERNQPLESGVIAFAPLDEQAGDIGIVFDVAIVAPVSKPPSGSAPGLPIYSARSAVVGDTLVARRAGRKLATAAISSNPAATAANVIGSFGRTL